MSHRFVHSKPRSRRRGRPSVPPSCVNSERTLHIQDLSPDVRSVKARGCPSVCVKILRRTRWTACSSGRPAVRVGAGRARAPAGPLVHTARGQPADRCSPRSGTPDAPGWHLPGKALGTPDQGWPGRGCRSEGSWPARLSGGAPGHVAFQPLLPRLRSPGAQCGPRLRAPPFVCTPVGAGASGVSCISRDPLLVYCRDPQNDFR